MSKTRSKSKSRGRSRGRGTGTGSQTGRGRGSTLTMRFISTRLAFQPLKCGWRSNGAALDYGGNVPRHEERHAMKNAVSASSLRTLERDATNGIVLSRREIDRLERKGNVTYRAARFSSPTCLAIALEYGDKVPRHEERLAMKNDVRLAPIMKNASLAMKNAVSAWSFVRRFLCDHWKETRPME